MKNLSLFRRALKSVHPEGIPFVGARLYNRLSRGAAFMRHYEMLARDICSYPGFEKLLDVGTGPGWLLDKIRAISPEAELCGLDLSPSMVDAARENLAHLSPPAEIVLGGAAGLPFPDGSFPMVVSTGSFHHWKQPEQALGEIFRVLAPGGHALIYDLLSDTPRSVYREAARDFGALKMLLFWLHAFEEPFYTRQAMLRIAEQSPFAGGETYYEGLFCCLRMRKPA